MNIGIDIDGVLFPWTDVANEVCVERFGIADPGPHVCWDHLKACLEPEQWRWLWGHEGQNEVFGRVERTYPDVVEAFNAVLRNPEHRVHFVTHRDPRYTALHTAAFLGIHFGAHPWAGLHVVQNAVSKRRLMAWDVFVDDKPETVHDFLANTDAQVFSPRRPWNEEELGDVMYHALHYYDDPWALALWLRMYA